MGGATVSWIVFFFVAVKQQAKVSSILAKSCCGGVLLLSPQIICRHRLLRSTAAVKQNKVLKPYLTKKKKKLFT